MESSPNFERLRGRDVVLDVSSPYVYLGRLVSWDLAYFHLENVDVHDLRDTHTTRDLYVLDAHRYGINCNRKRVMVRIADVVSLSALEDVTSE